SLCCGFIWNARLIFNCWSCQCVCVTPLCTPLRLRQKRQHFSSIALARHWHGTEHQMLVRLRNSAIRRTRLHFHISVTCSRSSHRVAVAFPLLLLFLLRLLLSVVLLDASGSFI